MDDETIARLKELLQRLGRSVHGAVVDSDEVNDGIAELRGSGWEAVMFLEASLLCRRDDEAVPGVDPLRIHVGVTHDEAEYRIDVDDARWLASLGISPTRHRSQPKHPLPPLRHPHTPTRDDG